MTTKIQRKAASHAWVSTNRVIETLGVITGFEYNAQNAKKKIYPGCGGFDVLFKRDCTVPGRVKRIVST